MDGACELRTRSMVERQRKRHTAFAQAERVAPDEENLHCSNNIGTGTAAAQWTRGGGDWGKRRAGAMSFTHGQTSMQGSSDTHWPDFLDALQGPAQAPGIALWYCMARSGAAAATEHEEDRLEHAVV